MDIRLFCCRCIVLLGLGLGYEAQNSYQTTHQRTDDVEEAEGEIDQCRDAENRTLRHTAGSHGTSTLVTVALSSVLRLKSSGR